MPGAGALEQFESCEILKGAEKDWISLVDQSLATLLSESESVGLAGDGDHDALPPSIGRSALTPLSTGARSKRR